MLNETHTSITQDMRECIQECNSCHDVCTESVTYCLQMGGEHANPNHIRLLLDCANICETSANFMLRGSDLHSRTCGVCAEVCERCAESCEKFEDDEMMQHCAQVCRSCAESCYEMAGVA